MNYFEIKTKYGGKFIEVEEKGGELSMYWLTGVAGAVLMAAPWIFSYTDNQAAVWTSLIAGLVVLGASLWEGIERRKENWEYWIAAVVGMFAILAPFAFGFGSHATAMWTTVIMGAVITALAGWELWLGSKPSRV